ncbi:MAG: type II toxin-antitoxin system HicA family toxin [Fimbriimonadales bacterium]
MSASLSSSEILAVLEAAGFQHVSQRGSHLKLRKVTGAAKLTVILKHPAKDVPQGTFASILKQAGLTRAEFDRLRRSK